MRMGLFAIYNAIMTAINSMGLMTFVIILIIDAVLWSIHPVLGMLAALFTFAILFGLIHI
jgi:hypothetical protein